MKAFNQTQLDLRDQLVDTLHNAAVLATKLEGDTDAMGIDHNLKAYLPMLARDLLTSRDAVKEITFIRTLKMYLKQALAYGQKYALDIEMCISAE